MFSISAPQAEYEQLEVTHINNGIYLESPTTTAYLTEDNFTSTLSAGDTVSISFYPNGEIFDVKGELNNKPNIYYWEGSN